MEKLLTGLKAIAETTRIRILFALSHGELNVSELTYILGQSQPRVSRHLKVLAEGGLITRHKEGNWVLFQLEDQGLGGALARAIVDMLPGQERTLLGDLARFEEVRRQRDERAKLYFASNAANWEALRSHHVDEAEVEATILALAGKSDIDSLVDLGTGTGRILQLFSSRAKQLLGLDSSREMLAIARAAIERDRSRNTQVRQADIYALPLGANSADLVVLHQVLHFLDEPQKALLEARRILTPNGRVLIVDFAPHNLEELRELHAHRKLGISTEQMAQWLERAGLKVLEHHVLQPPPQSGKELTVQLWLSGAISTSDYQPILSRERVTQ
jgi:ubiquinone/menaquinone biosynthesis C-methylase UbiE